MLQESRPHYGYFGDSLSDCSEVLEGLLSQGWVCSLSQHIPTKVHYGNLGRGVARETLIPLAAVGPLHPSSGFPADIGNCFKAQLCVMITKVCPHGDPENNYMWKYI